jgi:hypothetical protein
LSQDGKTWKKLQSQRLRSVMVLASDLVDAAAILNSESNILDTITMDRQLVSKLCDYQ